MPAPEKRLARLPQQHVVERIVVKRPAVGDGLGRPGRPVPAAVGGLGAVERQARLVILARSWRRRARPRGSRSIRLPFLGLLDEKLPNRGAVVRGRARVEQEDARRAELADEIVPALLARLLVQRAELRPTNSTSPPA